MKRTFENTYAVYLLTEDLLHIIYKKVPGINLKAAQLIVKDRMELQEGKTMPVLCDIREVRNIDKAARDYLALDGSLWVKKLALLVDPPVTDMISSIYLDTHAHKVPTRTFSNTSEALAYLEVKENDNN